MPNLKTSAPERPCAEPESKTVNLRLIPGGRSNATKGEMRNARRIPVNCQVKIRVTESDETAYGITKNLSVDGVSLITDYVPRFGQLMEIHVLPPQGSAIKPLCALVQVRRCHQVVAGSSYEIGTAILKIRE